MKTLISRIKSIKDRYLVLIIIMSVALRLINLGYSDYQGDEIKALYLPEQGESFSEYLMDQRKGPVQFIITFILKIFDNDYSNEFFIRLPFALAGILAVIYFYKFLKLFFSTKVAFYSSLFLTTNGFFIAFSRIVQYQSFVILFSVLALYFLMLAVKFDKYFFKGLYLSLIFWALSILSHYDGIFIAPMMFYLLFLWFKNKKITKKKKIINFIGAGSFSLFLLVAFYIPFIITISKDTMDYWTGRVTGDVSAKISSSKYLFTVYQPIYVVHFYTLFFFSGVLLFISSFTRNKFKEYLEKIGKVKIFSPYISGLFLHTDSKMPILMVFIWIAVPAFFWEYFVYIPGTHIYTYLLPMFVVLGFGVLLIEKIVNLVVRIEYRKVLNHSWMIVLFSFIFLQSMAVFVENRQEYPWESEKFLLWDFPEPTPIFHLSMFGFPYFRNWEGVREFTKDHPEITAYSTNERKSIVRYYVPLPKSSDDAGFYIYVRDPQSFENEIINTKPAYWVEKYEPDYTFAREGKNSVRVYIMPSGSLEQIINEGY